MARRIRFADGVGGDETDVLAVDNSPTPGGMSSYNKRARTDQFSEWRRGNYSWVEAERQAEIDAVVHPRPGAWDPWDLVDPAIEGNVAQSKINSRQRYRRRISRQAADGELMDENLSVELNRNPAAVTLLERFQAVGFGKVTRLGVGGRDVAFRFGMKDSQRRVHNVVVKLDLTDARSSIRDEVAVMKVSKALSLPARECASRGWCFQC